ncbi:Ig-like domain-containing protein, partial [Cerasicoccus frondis]|uniref:Ig-like domain-containing protein n=1 Tax=Cerasicoccus frondis TaxID=490090 RepID=UPI002852BB7C
MNTFKHLKSKPYLFCLIALLALIAPASASQVAVQVYHAPSLSAGLIQGDLWQLNGEGGSVNSGFTLQGDWRFPGEPDFRLNGSPTYSGVEPGDGSASPSGYRWYLNSGTTMGYLRTRTDPLPLLTANPVESPTGARTVHLNSASDSAGDFTTLLNLTIQNQVGTVAVPPGAYGNFTINANNGLELGVAGATEPVVYHFQRLNLNGTGRINAVGPVEIRVANSWYPNGQIGNQDHPEWLELHLPTGSFTLNSGSRLDGLVIAPNGRVTVNGNTTLQGGSSSKYFTLNSGGVVIGANLVSPENDSGENQAPIATSASFTLAEDTELSNLLSGTDPDGDTLTFSLASQPSHGVLSLAADGAFTYTPPLNYNGADAFSFQVDDGQAVSAPSTVSLTITPVNDAPTASITAFAISEDTPTAIDITANDIDGDTLSIAVENTAGGDLTGALDTGFIFSPDANYSGPASFTISVSDGIAEPVELTETFTITAVNDAPSITSAPITAVDEDALYSYAVSTNDPDLDDVVTLTTSDLPTWLTFDGATLSGTPTNDDVGSYDITLNATDLEGATDTQAFTITVSNVNDAPSITSAPITAIDEDALYSYVVTTSDPDLGDVITVTTS